MTEKTVTLEQAYEIMFKSYLDVVRVKDICSMLGICNKKVYSLIHSGIIPVIPGCRTYKAAKLSIISYLINCEKAA